MLDDRLGPLLCFAIIKPPPSGIFFIFGVYAILPIVIVSPPKWRSGKEVWLVIALLILRSDMAGSKVVA